MTTQDTGGPAFPQNTKVMHPAGQVVHQGFMGGMTLRDFFAAKATEEDIQAHIRKGYEEDFVVADGYGMKSIVKREAMWTREQAKYRYADAMLEARK